VTRHCDLAVIGAGFAGLAAAHAAALRGLDVVVLERKEEAGARPHTTGLLVKEVADWWDVPRGLTHKIHGVRLYGPSLRSVELVRQGYHFLATDTPGLMRWWARQARAAGASILYRALCREGCLDIGAVRLDGCDVRARYLLGADGARSQVARAFGLGVNRRFLVGMEAEYEGVEGVEEDCLHVFLDSRIAPGYIAWVVPGVGRTQVGLAATKLRRGALDAFVARVRGLFDFTRASLIGSRGGLIPVGGPVRPMGRPGVMLVGDAAGMVSPLTAGGIHTALLYGRLAGLAVTDHLLDAGRDPARVLRRAAPAFRAKRLLRAAWDLPLPDAVYDLALRSRLFRSFAQAVFFHNRGLLSWQAWADVWRLLRSGRMAGDTGPTPARAHSATPPG
jgi:flavin-dependent dehydrogenase